MSENIISELLSKLNLGSRPSVCISVTPGLGVEMIQIDPNNHMVKSYAVKPLTYNDSLREISNIEEFKTAVAGLFEELNISPKANVILNLPMVLFGTIELPLFIGDEAITGGISNEVEQSYIFKRHDPVVSWMDASGNSSGEMRKLIYSAMQQLVIDNVKMALAELGANLVSVQMSLASTLRALDYTGLASEQMKDGITWNLLTVNSSGYTLVSMVGKNIVDYYEEPIPIKSYEGDEIYNAINSSAQITLMSYPANYLMVISDTDAVSAEILAKQLKVECTVSYLENNHFKKQEFLPASLDVLPDNVIKVSLQAIGAGVSKISGYPITFDFMSAFAGETISTEETVRFRVGDKDFELTPTAGRNIAIAGAAAIAAIPLALYLLMPMTQTKQQAQLDELNASIQQVDKQIKDLETAQAKSGSFDIKNEINTVMKNNRSKLMTYSAIGEAVPSKLWLTYFMTQADGQVNIKGVSTTVEDVYLFFRNLKESLAGNQLKLHKLEMQSGSIDDVVSSGSSARYEFEITNMAAAQANPAPADPNNPDANAEQGAAPASAAEAQPAQADGSGAGLLGDQPVPDIGS